MDQMSQDLHAVQQAVTDLTSLMSKLQAQLTDLNNAIKVMSTPAPPPPGATSGGAWRYRRRHGGRRGPGG